MTGLMNEFNPNELAAISWPDKRIRIQNVANINSMEIPCFPSFIKNSSCANEVLSMAFKRAADIAVFHHDKDSPRLHPDSLYMPIMYLYRHSIELLLKEFVFQLKQLRLINQKDADSALDLHNLHKLWNLIKPTIISSNPKGNPKIVSNAELILQDLHIADNNGQLFRYATGKGGSVTSNDYPDFVDLKQIHDGISALHNFLSGCLNQIDQ